MNAFPKAVSAVLVTSALALSGCAALRPGAHQAARSREAVRPSTAPSPSGLIGKLNGGIIGDRIGSRLSSSDRQMALEAEYRALEETPSGKEVTWQDPGSGASGSVVAASPYQVGSQNCRQYTHTVTIEGRTYEARGAACRNRDGSWTPLS